MSTAFRRELVQVDVNGHVMLHTLLYKSYLHPVARTPSLTMAAMGMATPAYVQPSHNYV